MSVTVQNDYMAKSIRRTVLCFAWLLPVLSGCSYLPWPESFGEVSGANSMRGLNGMGAHRRMWESTGARVLTPHKLSPRLDSIDTIVLIGSSYEPPGSLARDWLEKWLGEKSGRTVVYFGRDFDASLMYREETLNQVAEKQRSRAQTQLASKLAEKFVVRSSAIPEDTFCRWFFLRTSARPTVHESFTGPWSDALKGLEGNWPTGVLLEPPDSKLKNKKPSWITSTKPALAPPPTRVFVPGLDDSQELGDKEVQRSIWKTDELEDSKAWDAEWQLAGEAQLLLAGQNGAPLVYRIEHSKFTGSKILIVANGAPFLNGSLVKPLQRKLSELIIEECLPAKRVAMIEYNENGLLLSNVDSGSETDFGVALLTVWPLSAITMHAAFFGIIAFAVLLPILGRPQSLTRRTITDFGLHVEAMGRMMFESRDLMYGIKSIQDYFSKVRRETPPEWLTQMATHEAQQQAALMAAKLNSNKAASPTAPSSSAPSSTVPPPDKPTNGTPPDPVS